MTDAQKDVMTIVQYMLGKDENPTEEKIKEEVDKCSVLIPGGLTDGQMGILQSESCRESSRRLCCPGNM